MSWLCALGWVVALTTGIYFITYKCLDDLGEETPLIKWICTIKKGKRK